MTSSTCTVHALNDVIFSQGVTIKLTGVLSATIGVDYGAPDVRICYKSILHRMLAKRCFHRGFHCQFQHCWVKTIEDCWNIEFSIFCLDLSDICYAVFPEAFLLMWNLFWEDHRIYELCGLLSWFLSDYALDDDWDRFFFHNPINGTLTGEGNAFWLF